MFVATKNIRGRVRVLSPVTTLNSPPRVTYLIAARLPDQNPIRPNSSRFFPVGRRASHGYARP